AIVCADILNHWDITKARQWENAHPDYPSIQLALGMKYKEVGLILDSMRCLKQYTKLSPDMKGYEALAELYRSQGQDEQWVATLQEFLDKTEAVSLEHAQVQYQIANYYMDKGKYKEAAPFADAAAETGAAWGLSCGAQAHTGLGEFARAEQLLVEEMEHYSTSPYNWYAWCVETGRGHRDAARSALAKYLREKGDTISQEDLLQSGIADWVEGKPADGIAALQKRMARAPGPLSLVHLMVLADEAGEAPTRDAAVKQIAGLHDGDPNTIVFAKELARAIGAGPDGKLDLAAVDAIISKTSGADQIEFRALTARYLLNHKQKDSATRYVKACYGTFRGYCVGNLLVYQTSRDLGLDPLKLAGIAPEASEGTP
ncbi:MAG TPA: hypothetical protein VFE47_20585, partial [Tepidisphaeraceae bacterium]|nr:hypothetical protein [Tepidisphaeraceae bacterium]